jgi:2-C-methyl-D-erythritol 2,4-cyclodiphosphate synthase
MAQAGKPSQRIGHGYDLHRLEPVAPQGPGRPFILAGVRLDHPCGPVGHSDGDVIYHAVTDAILGALGHCQQPRIAAHKPRMIENLAGALGCELNRVNLKGKTHEEVDAVGEGRAVEAHAVVLLEKR